MARNDDAPTDDAQPATDADADAEETPLEAYHRQERERKQRQADVDIPVEAGDRVSVTSIFGVPEGLLESVDGYPIEGTVKRVEYRTEGCRNLSCEAVVRVRFTEAECPAVYNGTTEVYPIGGVRDPWSEAPIEALDADADAEVSG